MGLEEFLDKLKEGKTKGPTPSPILHGIENLHGLSSDDDYLVVPTNIKPGEMVYLPDSVDLWGLPGQAPIVVPATTITNGTIPWPAPPPDGAYIGQYYQTHYVPPVPAPIVVPADMPPEFIEQQLSTVNVNVTESIPAVMLRLLFTVECDHSLTGWYSTGEKGLWIAHELTKKDADQSLFIADEILAQRAMPSDLLDTFITAVHAGTKSADATQMVRERYRLLKLQLQEPPTRRLKLLAGAQD